MCCTYDDQFYIPFTKDVYKRQIIKCLVYEGVKPAEIFYRLCAEFGKCTHFKAQEMYKRCMPVSYTHLDVYKRQALTS